MSFVTSKGLKNVNFKLLPNDFTFFVGDKQYRCPIFVAEFLSPKIAKMRKEDATIVSYRMNCPDTKGVFEDFLNIGRGLPIEKSDEKSDAFSAFAGELENGEIYFETRSVDSEHITVRKALSFIETKERFGLGCEAEFDALASRFCEANEEDYVLMSFGLLQNVLSRPTLKIWSEDWLAELILKLSGEGAMGRQALDLLEFVNFEYLSTNVLETVVKTVGPGGMTAPIWKAFSRRLLGSAHLSAEEEKKRLACITVAIPVDCRDPLNGILTFLGSKFSSIVDEHIVELSCSGTADGSSGVDSILDPNPEVCFRSNDQEDPWICIHVTIGQIVLTDYSVRSAPNVFRNNSRYHPKSWVVEVSDDGSKWKTADKRQKASELNGFGVTHTFKCSSELTGSWIRFKQTDNTYGGDRNVAVSRFELFGSIVGIRLSDAIRIA